MYNIKQYQNGNTTVRINLLDGTKERFTKDDEFKPEFAESIDCCITYKCDKGCYFCYADCKPDGRHANLESPEVDQFIKSLKPYTELAINGNDLDIPSIEWFLFRLKFRNIICNITIHQDVFMKNTDKLSEWSRIGWIHGIGVSLSDPTDGDFIEQISHFRNAVIHIVAGIHDISLLADKNLKVLILGYKKKGRGVGYLDWKRIEVGERIHNLKEWLPNNINRFQLVSFDNLAIDQLNIKDILSEKEWEEFYMGDEGSHTFFVDLVNRTFARDSLTPDVYDIDGRDAVEMFQYIQKEM